ncbi:MAG: TIGR02285 family protein [Pseudomonadota bacterium]
MRCTFRSSRIAGLLAAGLLLACPARAGESMTWLMPDFPPIGIPVHGQPTDGMADQLVKYIVSRWPEASHRFLYANPNRVWSMLASGEQVCFTGALRTQERERFAYFRNTYLLPPPQLIIRPEVLAAIPLNARGEAEPGPLMNNASLHGLVIEKRAYGHAVDALLAQPAASPNIKRLAASNYGKTIFTMMTMNRGDYTIDYDFVLAHAALTDTQLARLKAIPLAGADALIVGGIACPRTPWGRATVQKIDALLASHEGSSVLLQAQARWISRESASRYDEAMKEFFRRLETPQNYDLP